VRARSMRTRASRTGPASRRARAWIVGGVILMLLILWLWALIHPVKAVSASACISTHIYLVWGDVGGWVGGLGWGFWDGRGTGGADGAGARTVRGVAEPAGGVMATERP
jgi:hypothetical protein